MRTDDLDAIDGFGLTFSDLSEAGQRKLLFRLLRGMGEAQRAEMGAALDQAQTSLDKSQARLRSAIATPITKSTSTRKK